MVQRISIRQVICSLLAKCRFSTPITNQFVRMEVMCIQYCTAHGALLASSWTKRRLFVKLFVLSTATSNKQEQKYQSRLCELLLTHQPFCFSSCKKSHKLGVTFDKKSSVEIMLLVFFTPEAGTQRFLPTAWSFCLTPGRPGWPIYQELGATLRKSITQFWKEPIIFSLPLT